MNERHASGSSSGITCRGNQHEGSGGLHGEVSTGEVHEGYAAPPARMLLAAACS
jgi:hypothetical protein